MAFAALAVVRPMAGATRSFFSDLAREMPKDSSLFYDWVHFTNGGAARRPVTILMDKQGDDAALSFLSDLLTDYRVIYKGKVPDRMKNLGSGIAAAMRTRCNGRVVTASSSGSCAAMSSVRR